jgi:hypothetical protein
MEKDPLDVAVHPALARSILQLATPIPRVILHGGAVVVGDSAWVVFGRRHAGKSTLLHAAHHRGLSVLSDDISVIADGYVLAGPRCLDLRAPTLGSLPVRAGERHRVTLPPVGWRSPLAGIAHLAWSDRPDPRITELPPADRVTAFLAESRHHQEAGEATAVLDLAVLPGYVLSRNPDGDPDLALDLLLEVTARTANQPVGSARARTTGRTA